MKDNVSRVIQGTRTACRAHETSVALTDSNAFGMIGFPASSFTAEIFATHSVGTSDENESGGAFATRRTVTISIQNGLHKYYVYNHMYRASTCSSPYQPYLNTQNGRNVEEDGIIRHMPSHTLDSTIIYESDHPSDVV